MNDGCMDRLKGQCLGFSLTFCKVLMFFSPLCVSLLTPSVSPGSPTPSLPYCLRINK